MSLNLIGRNRQRFPKEGELIQAEARLREATGPVQRSNCPNYSQLKSFAAGEYAQGNPTVETIMDHLLDCDSCLATMAEIRTRASSEKRLPIRGRRRLFLAGVAVLALAALCFWAFRTRTPSTPVAIVDLRQVTRGNEDSSIALHRESRAIRVLLPVGSAAGDYTIAIFGSAAPLNPILLASARSTVGDGEVVVIVVSISLKQLRPGPYLLGVRHGNSKWHQYAITIK